MNLDEEIAFWRKHAEENETDAWLVAMGMALGLAGDAAQNMKTEIERLKAALREIADLSSVSVRAPHIARAALEGKP